MGVYDVMGSRSEPLAAEVEDQWAGDGAADAECSRWVRWLPWVTGWGNRTCEVVVTGGKGQVADRRGCGVLPLWPFAGEERRGSDVWWRGNKEQ
jgi:hypothetical protein